MLLPLQLFLLLTALAAGCLGQKTYYCDSTGKSSIEDTDFYIDTKNAGSRRYDANMRCSFLASGRSLRYFIEVLDFDMHSAKLEISSYSSQVFKGSSINDWEKNLVTPSSSLDVTFDSYFDYVRGSGVRLRVRAFSSGGCPPDWQQIGNSCYGTSSPNSVMSFANAQKSCNNMQANLLQVSGFSGGDLSSLKRRLPSSLTSRTWIGMTDLTSYGQYTYRWLDGTRFSGTSDITCSDGGSRYSCNSYQRCAAFTTRFGYAVEMTPCSYLRNYVCSMPQGGTSRFYKVPSSGIISVRISSFRWYIWTPLCGGVFTIGLIVAFIIYSRQRNQRRGVAAGPRPPPGSYPSQMQQQQQQQPYSIRVGGPMQHGTLVPPPPPAYNAVDGQQAGPKTTPYPPPPSY